MLTRGLHRLVAVLLALCVFALSGMAALAEGKMARVGDTDEYDTLEEALNAAQAGDTIYVLQSHDISKALTVEKAANIKGVSEDVVLTRAADINLFEIKGNACATFTDIILDGGAVWENNDPTAEGAMERKHKEDNTGLVSKKSILLCAANGALTLGAGAVVRNGDCSTAHIAPAVVSYGAFTMEEGSVIENCTAITADSSGAVNSRRGEFDMNGGVIRGCRADSNGGGGGAALLVYGGEATMSGNASIEENYTYADGAVYVREGAKFYMRDDSSIRNNVGGGLGGIALITNSTLEMSGNASIANNRSGMNTTNGQKFAAGLTLIGATASMRDNASITGNVSTQAQGGVYNREAVLNMYDNAVISGNSAAMAGGGVYNRAAALNMYDNARINGNSTAVNGGGVCNRDGSFLMMNGAAVRNNSAAKMGDDIYSYENGQITLTAASGVLDGCNELITGWYYDGMKNGEEANRWHVNGCNDGTAQYGEEYVIVQKDGSMLALKAAHYIVYGVNYDLAGGSWQASAGEPGTVRLPAESRVALGADPVREGFLFSGWSVSTDDSSVTAPALDADGFALPAANVTLTANWTAAPVDPVDPVDPIDPVDPVDPEEPEEPEIPLGPADADAAVNSQIPLSAPTTGGETSIVAALLAMLGAAFALIAARGRKQS